MASFLDAEGREWFVNLRVRDVRAVNEKLGILLTEITLDDELYMRMRKDYALVSDILWLLVEKQAKQQKVARSDNEGKGFEDMLCGEGMEKACAALEDALADFLRPQEAELLKAMQEAMTEELGQMPNRIAERRDTLLQEFLIVYAEARKTGKDEMSSMRDAMEVMENRHLDSVPIASYGDSRAS